MILTGRSGPDFLGSRVPESSGVMKTGNNSAGEPVNVRPAAALRSLPASLSLLSGRTVAVRAHGNRFELEVAPSLLMRLLAHAQERRDYLGRTEPYWSMLTAREFRGDSIASTKDAFYATGAPDVALFQAAAERCGVLLPWYGTCFELGCGVGRITPWLSEMFDHIIGADISPSHLALADQLVRQRRYSNIHLHLLNRLDALEAIPPFESFFSLIALQHKPPPLMYWFLRAMLEKLKPGGIGFFQLPVFARDGAFVVSDYLENPPPHGEIEVHALPLTTVFALMESAGCDLLEMREHDCLGPYPDWLSKTFLIRKAWY